MVKFFYAIVSKMRKQIIRPDFCNYLFKLRFKIMSTYALADFHSERPQFETTQEEGIEWLAAAHAKSSNENDALERFRSDFSRIGCKPIHIHKRGHELPDFLHREWSDMEIFHYDVSSESGLRARQAFHSKSVEAVFNKFYPTNALPPDHIIHVSCTGYESPSAPQKLVSKRGWGNQTLITHAYHMGCYASIPAIRMASALSQRYGGKIDIVHTELCTLHFNPANHNADQIVLQSLFADGYIKYSVEASHPEANQMQIIAEHEQLIPESTDAMTWSLTDSFFEGTLSKRIPLLIAKNVRPFIENLTYKAGMDVETILQKALFAIHPGGPKILDYIKDILNLSSSQLHYSHEILFNYGNMSSGTLPHIWQAIANDDAVSDGAVVISLAFGPGLNIAGAILIKNGGR
jgi:predicted naringenin-chalcone synthase